MLEVEYVIFTVRSHSASFQHEEFSCSVVLCSVSVNCLHKSYVVQLYMKNHFALIHCWLVSSQCKTTVWWISVTILIMASCCWFTESCIFSVGLPQYAICTFWHNSNSWCSRALCRFNANSCWNHTICGLAVRFIWHFQTFDDGNNAKTHYFTCT